MRERLPRIAFIAVEVLLLIAVPVLAVRGFGAVLDTTEGRKVDPELDPDDPGYEAFVTSSPVMAALGLDDTGALSWATVLGLAGPDGGGAVVFVPAATVVADEAAYGLVGQTLAERYASAGADGARLALADLAGVEIGEAVELPPTRVAELLAPVSPLTVDNIDEIGEFGVGPQPLDGAQVAALLSATDPNESDFTRLARHEEVWRAWIAAIAASSSADVVPGERTSGIGRFLGGVAAGAVTYDVPPLLEAPRPDGSTTFVADAQATVDLFEERVPFPAAARIGGRVRVSVLDGVGAEGLAAAAGRDVVRAGGQVVVVGNADRFDSVGTRVVYFDGALADRVEAFAEQLGVEAELSTDPNPDDRIDVIVVVGSEAAAAYGLPLRPTTNGDDAG